MSIPLPPRHVAPVPRLDTLHEIEAILRAARSRGEGPLSFAEIKRRMSARSVRHATVRAVIEELKRFHLVAEGSKGVMWVLHEDPNFWNRPVRPLA